MVYKDRTFCVHQDCPVSDCSRKLTQKIIQGAIDAEMYLSVCDFEDEGCRERKRSVNEEF